MDKRNKSLYVAIAIIVILIIILLRSCQNNVSKGGVLWEEETKPSIEISYISIVGFSELYFEADELHQEMSYHNPETNNCTMDVDLRLPDGEVLFEEKNIQPGYGIKEVTLKRTLQEGTYSNCKFAVRCYSSDGVQYNGAILTVNLFVR